MANILGSDSRDSGAMASPFTRKGRGAGSVDRLDCVENPGSGAGWDCASHGAGKAHKAENAVLRINRRADRSITPTSSRPQSAVR